ncbi:hypothetical protein H5407_07295 [Mitsuaria sp. WAJ17]|uniref:hypothetical protein n=1 Tax=Mitsuaria sp. WAJ17 TaxID=2761452 RepID=UPI001601AE75|nr:hypothetical protein [Mitsuaria sp. WAJ17]MBB2485034.1 hypothetical protein [Mitsuaria sp. WAJ17]
MTRITDRLRSLFRRAGPAERDPLDYGQMVHLDAEDLAEGGILSAYQQLLPLLRRYASSPLEVTEEGDDDGATYCVAAGGKKYVIWDIGAKSQDGWARATVAFFDIVNASLASSEHRFYALYGGNDLSGLFLTEQEFAAARRAIKKPAHWPWVPVNQPPHYGYPVEGAV